MYGRLIIEVFLRTAFPWLVAGCLARVTVYWAAAKRTNKEAAPHHLFSFFIETCLSAMFFGIPLIALLFLWRMGIPNLPRNAFTKYNDIITVAGKLLGALSGFLSVDIHSWIQRTKAGKLLP
jgi:hypothetical protein